MITEFDQLAGHDQVLLAIFRFVRKHVFHRQRAFPMGKHP